tara:strand:+ start:2644 stop:2796 length:153 start_codon:yes stop_codon:yes gene_type:complete
MCEYFVVWVGGVVVNEYYLHWDKAYNLAQTYIDGGYDDVILESKTCYLAR